MRLKATFIVSFLLIGVSVAGIGAFAISTATRVSRDFDSLVETSAPALLTLGEIQAVAERYEARVKGLALLEAGLQKVGRRDGSKATEAQTRSRIRAERNKLEGLSTELAELRARYESLATDDADLATTRELQTTWSSLLKAGEHLLAVAASDAPWAAWLEAEEALEDANWIMGICISGGVNRERELLAAQHAEALQNERRALTLMVLAVLAALVMAAVVGGTLGRKIVGRIHALKTAAARIGSGDLSVRLRGESSDEIGELAASFAEMAKNLELSYAELLRKNRELDEFTYIASHDLQEPLRKLVSFSTLLPEDAGTTLPEAALKDLDFITDAARRMQRLVEDLLVLSRVGRTEAKREPVDMNACVQAALEALEIRVKETGANIMRDELPEVRGDATLITQLYQNLIGNALKFTHARAPEVRIGVEARDGRRVFTVRDNGIGIEPEYSQQIFAPFKRLHGRGQFDGTGIGLAVCRKAVEQHGGTIEVRSCPGEGSEFRFTLDGHREERTCRTEASA